MYLVKIFCSSSHINKTLQTKFEEGHHMVGFIYICLTKFVKASYCQFFAILLWNLIFFVSIQCRWGWNFPCSLDHRLQSYVPLDTLTLMGTFGGYWSSTIFLLNVHYLNSFVYDIASVKLTKQIFSLTVLFFFWRRHSCLCDTLGIVVVKV